MSKTTESVHGEQERDFRPLALDLASDCAYERGMTALERWLRRMEEILGKTAIRPARDTGRP